MEDQRRTEPDDSNGQHFTSDRKDESKNNKAGNERRSLVATGVAGLILGAAGLLSLGKRQSGTPLPPATATDPSALPSETLPANRPVLPTSQMALTESWKSPELRLARRITLGLTEAEASRARQMGYDAYLEYQLNYHAIDDSEVENYIARNLPTVAMTPEDCYSKFDGRPGAIGSEVLEATFRRSIGSNRQLFQRMVEFWNDHFNVYICKVPYVITHYDRDVIRAFALDTFPNLLKATAHSPAMMLYLDNATSQASAPNQNYARELMELMTLGVDGGYTQKDVIEVARCFTGWSANQANVDPSQVTFNPGPPMGAFMFKPELHDDGEKVVLGHTIPAGGGQSDGEMVLDILTKHPSTARFISRKLCVWLLDYDPPTTLVDSVAKTYLSTGGDIRAMIRAILHKPNLMTAPAKYKRPYHLIVSAVRATQASLGPSLWPSSQNNDPQYNSKDPRLTPAFQWPEGNAWLGHIPFLWPEPNGYPDSLAHWTGLLLPRCNFGVMLASNHLPGLTCDVSRLVKAGSAEAVADTINRMLFASEMPAQEKEDMIEFLQQTGESPIGESLAREALAVGLASPAFQWY